MADLEGRVAALEAALAFAVTCPPPRPLTEAEMAGLAEHLAEAVRLGPLPRFIPSVPPLTPEQVRCLLRECVTVVKPGETLIIRVPLSWSPDDVLRYQQDVNDIHDEGYIPFKVFIIGAEEMGVADPEPGGVPGAA